MISPYITHIIILIGIYAILAISLNLILGFTGLLNVAHAAIFGIGAYSSALLTLKLGFPFLLGLITAGIISTIIALLIGMPTLKLKGDYFALGTIGLAFIIIAVMKNWVSLTRGPLGIPGIKKPVIFGLNFANMEMYLLLIVIFVIITYFVINRLVKAPFGMVLKAIREDETRAVSMGKNVFKYKMAALGIGSFFAGIAGSLYAHYITFIDPSSFQIMEAILLFSIVLIGGMGSLLGSIIGAAILIILPEPLRFIGFPSSIAATMRQIIYALILIILVLKRPQGIIGEYSFK